MENYQPRVPPSASSLIQITLTPPSLHSSRNCCVWVPCHPQPRPAREEQWTLTRAFVSEGPRLVRPVAHSTARIAHACLPSRRRLGEDTQVLFDASVCFMSGWRRIGDRRTLGEFAFNRNQNGSLPTSTSTRAFFVFWLLFFCAW